MGGDKVPRLLRALTQRGITCSLHIAILLYMMYYHGTSSYVANTF
jgi:hypothetical protein